MKTIVHIGMAKTGTTTLQGCLQQSATYLAERRLLYPENPPGSRSITHALLLALIFPFEGLSRLMKNGRGLTKDNIGDKLDEFLRHVRRQIERQRPDGLILSTEGLFVPLPEDKQETFRQCLYGLGGKPSFVAYLRRPSEYYLSHLQQRLKASALVIPPRPTTYRKVLESYDACFGTDAVSARLFHRDHLEKGDVTADFCKHYLAEFEVDPAKLRRGIRDNATLSAESMHILQRYRKAFHSKRHNVFTKDTNELIAALAEADHLHGAGRPKLRPGIAETIDYASYDCLWVRDRHGVVFPELDYDRLAAATVAPDRTRTFKLKDLLVIDRALQARLLDSLAQTPWAAEDATRKAWLRQRFATSNRTLASEMPLGVRRPEGGRMSTGNSGMIIAAAPDVGAGAEDPIYARGYLITAIETGLPRPGWRHIRFSDLHVFYDPRNHIARAKQYACEVLILGITMDVEHPGRSEQEIATSLVGALERGRSGFIEKLDALAGRHIILFRTADACELLGDATQMRSVFFSGAAPLVVASHARLVAEIARSEPAESYVTFTACPGYVRWPGHYLPGRMTPWKGVFTLTANTSLNCVLMDVRRFWPRQDIPARETGELAHEISADLKAQVANLAARRRPLVCSLTGGMDSRTAVSITQGSGEKIRYFTYGGRNFTEADVTAARRIADRLSLVHEVLQIPAAADESWFSVVRNNVFNKHIDTLPLAYMKAFSQDTIHIRSNIAEIGRAYYRRHMNKYEFSRTNISLATMWWKRKFVRRAAASRFREWARATDFWSVDKVDFADLFYWEHRMSCWHGSLVLESDTAFDTVSLFNCRKILTALLSAPFGDRLSDAVQRRIIEEECTALLAPQ